MSNNVLAFLEPLGYVCNNPRTAWSYVNHATKTVAFSMWEDLYSNEDKSGVIFDYNWKNKNGQMLPDTKASAENLRLVGFEGYELKVFFIEAEDTEATPRIRKRVLEALLPATLCRVGSKYYASLKTAPTG